MKCKKWFWGIFFLMGGAAIILSALGWLGDINIFSLLFTILLIPIMITSIPDRNFFGILFPLALIGILYAKPLGITKLSPWPLLFAALLISIGLTMMFHRKKHYPYSDHEEHFDTVIDQKDSEVVKVDVHFGSSIKYVNSKNFQKGIINCSFGALKVYFDNAKITGDHAELTLDASFSGVELYIPKEWHIIDQTETSLGGIEQKNEAVSTNGKTITLKGHIRLSGVEIIYIS